MPVSEGKYTFYTDACDKKVEFVSLKKKPDTIARPIGYWKRSLKKGEREYETTNSECLLVVWALLMLRPYLEGRRFKVRTTHDVLQWIINVSDATGKMARWILRLQKIAFDI